MADPFLFIATFRYQYGSGLSISQPASANWSGRLLRHCAPDVNSDNAHDPDRLVSDSGRMTG
jgi:hypothetical protein